MWGLASPQHPQGRTEFCTLRILRMLLWCGSAAVDYVAPPLWITHLTVLWITMLRICGLRERCSL